jgi:hypothetical protein
VKTHYLLFCLLSVISTITFAGCNDNDVAGGTGSEVAVAAISGAGNASENLLAQNGSKQPPSRYARLKTSLALIPDALAIPSCSWSNIAKNCTDNTATISFDGCSNTTDPAIKISGSESFSWSGSGCCTLYPGQASSVTPCSFNRRTVNAAGAVDPLIHSVGAHSVILNTEDITGFNQARTGGFVVSCQGVSGNETCDGQRQVVIAGAHYTGHSGNDDWDHTVSTDQPLVVQGHGETRKVLSGVVRVQHNLAHVTSITTIVRALTHREGCCLPTGGEISTSFIGGKEDGKTETMTFGPGCGESSLEDTEHRKSGFALRHCL